MIPRARLVLLAGTALLAIGGGTYAAASWSPPARQAPAAVQPVQEQVPAGTSPITLPATTVVTAPELGSQEIGVAPGVQGGQSAQPVQPEDSQPALPMGRCGQASVGKPKPLCLPVGQP